MRDTIRGGLQVRLTQEEFDLLVHLFSHPGVVFCRDELLEHAWHLDCPGATRTLDVHVAQLRRELGRSDLIETVHGVGYKTPRA